MRIMAPRTHTCKENSGLNYLKSNGKNRGKGNYIYKSPYR